MGACGWLVILKLAANSEIKFLNVSQEPNLHIAPLLLITMSDVKNLQEYQHYWHKL